MFFFSLKSSFKIFLKKKDNILQLVVIVVDIVKITESCSLKGWILLCELCLNERETETEKWSKESEDKLEGQGQGKESHAVTLKL